MSGLVAVSYFLISVIFGMTTLVLWLRFGLRYFRISPLHPVRQIIQRMTDPIFHPLQRAAQFRLTPVQRYDWLCFVVLVGVEWLKSMIISILYFGHTRDWILTGAYTVVALITQPCDLLFYALLIRAIMSWINPHWHHPLATLLFSVTEPLLQQIRRYIPIIAGLDFSPFITMILLKAIALFVSASLPFHI
ncbi:MAG: YggT family protein [Legionellales bacterium]|nr:YggT family protein [Legionellales bacterium]